MMFTTNYFRGKRVTVQGLGHSGGGVGTVQFLAASGAREIIVTDQKDAAALSASLALVERLPGIRLVLGGHHKRDFEETDVVIKNPAVPWTNEFVGAALARGIPVTMDSAIFFAVCPVPIVGVTGSKGKTTTASLIVHLLRSVGKAVVPVGIGDTPVLGMLDHVTPTSLVVFELSSWRLSALPSLSRSPQVAVVTNIIPDHLNYYGTVEEYVRDKKNIYRFQGPGDVLITNADNTWTQTMAAEAPGQTILFSAGPLPKGYGVTAGGMCVEAAADGIHELFPRAALPLPGEHNIGNILAAVAAARSLGLSRTAIQEGVRSFRGVPHRLERVEEINAVSYYNDSAATIPEATLAALHSFRAPIVLIAGGNDKNLDYAPLARVLPEITKGVVFLPGTGTDILCHHLRARGVSYPVVTSMDAAVAAAAKQARPGSVVLLSPGATSFGLFQNEFDRGERFRAAVRALSSDKPIGHP